MLDSKSIDDIIKIRFLSNNKLLQRTLLLFSVVGAGAFAYGIYFGKAISVWRTLLVNFVFLSGLGFGGIAFSAILTTTKATWGRPIKRLAELTASFLLVSLILLVVMFGGMDALYQWMEPGKVIISKSWWLNVDFFVIRNIVVSVVFILVVGYYLFTSIQPDLILLKRLGLLKKPRLWMKVRDSGGNIFDNSSPWSKKHQILAPAVLILAIIFSTMVAFDWMMSLDQEWFSALFGLYYAVSGFYSALALLMLLTLFARKIDTFEGIFPLNRVQDLSRLTFATSLIWAYMVYSQVLVIWYADLPHETAYLELRLESGAWSLIFWILLVLLLLIPFFGLLSKTACRSPKFSGAVGFIALIGLWLEKYFLISPSIKTAIGFGVVDLLLTFGVLSLSALVFIRFLNSVPWLPIADSLLDKT